MKNIFYVVLMSCLFCGCSDFLDTESYTQKNSKNYPATENDMYLAVCAIYNKLLPTQGEIGFTQIFVELLSDDRFGGGGSSDYSALSINDFTTHDINEYRNQWGRIYQGIYIANFYIEQDAKDQITWSNEILRNQYLGEAYFLRAFFYLDLGRMFGNVPMPLSSKNENLPQATAEELYGQIAFDLKMAINLLQAVRFNDMTDDNLGHATRWAAEGLMARAFLFYTGFYNKTEIELPDGTVVNKSEVVSWIDDCVANSGHSLVPNFRNLWMYAASKDYKYSKDHNLEWVGDGKSNPETVFATKFNSLGSENQSFSNIKELFFGWRNQNSVPFGSGWGFGPVNPQLYEQWPDNDIRKFASICYVDDKENEGELYYQDNQWNAMQDTRMWAKKTMPVNEWPTEGPKFDSNGFPTNGTNISVRLFGATTNSTQNNVNDQIEIRYADILLMGAELGGPKAQEYMDMVRDRVNLSSLSATLENIKLERRYELAFEGVRYWDLLRWHDAEKAYAKIRKVPCINDGRPGHVTVRFRPETKGFMQIPQQEIIKSNGVLKQNEGWSENPNFDINKVYNE